MTANHTTTAHGQFTIDRRYGASPARTFAAWSDPAIRRQWFTGPEGWSEHDRRQDFRVGGTELLRGAWGDMETRFSARYHVIEQDACIVMVYDMHVGGRHHSVSIMTVEFVPEGAGTLLRLTEQVTFVDDTKGYEGTRSREHGTDQQLVRMAMVLDVETTRAMAPGGSAFSPA
jgi:uncharacterized protein YndB with AHSA1/START domain